MTTIAETVSRIRNGLKAVKEDAFITDRYIYSVVLKYAKAAIRRQDNENKIMRFSSIFKTLPCVELIEVNKVEACCGDIKSDCTIMRTKDKLPKMIEGSIGPIFRSVASIDGMQELSETYRPTYVSMTKLRTFKYNSTKYYWYADGYLYFPNIEWDSVLVQLIPEADVSYLTCDPEAQCKPMQQQDSHIPDYLMAEIEQPARLEILQLFNTPQDGPDDKQNPIR